MSLHSNEFIYLDANATTPMAVEVADAMTGLMRRPLNAGGAHAAGRAAEAAIDAARRQVAALINAAPTEVIFTSGATEANALAIEGVARSSRSERRKIVSAVWEHHAVLEPLRRLERDGWHVTLVGLDSSGRPSLSELNEAIDEETLLVSLMAVNNETGVVSQLQEVSGFCRGRGALLHSDATQAAPWGHFDVDDLGVDLASLSAHKLHGPQGVGALFVRRELRTSGRIAALVPGGGQESGLRGGTVNVAGVVGFGVAASLAGSLRDSAATTSRLRDAFEVALLERIPEASVNGYAVVRAPGTSNVRFAGLPADALMAGVPQLAVSTGSACRSGAPEPSHVLLAMGLEPELADSSLRFSLSRYTTRQELDVAVGMIVASVNHLREVFA